MQHNCSKPEIAIEFDDGKFFSIAAEREEAANSLLELAEKTAIENGEEYVQLLEGNSYEYELPEGYSLKNIPRVVRPSHRKNKQNLGRITPGIYVGRLPLVIEGKDGKIFELAVEVRSIKAEYRSEYRKMLEDITGECTDLLMLHSSPVTQTVTVNYEGDSQTLYQRFAFVKSIIDSDSFRNAVHRVISMPVTYWSQRSEEVDIRRSRRIASKQIRQIASRSDRIKLPCSHPLYSKLDSVPLRLTTEIKTDTVDTPENRFVKHILKEFERFCGVICLHIEEKYKEQTKYPHIYIEAKALEDKFAEYLSHSMFREIQIATSLPLNSPILQRKEGYREILRVWLMYDLAAKLVWEAMDDSYQVGKRDVATLYEYWLFFKLLRLVESIFNIGSKQTKDLIKETSDGLGLQLRAGVHTAIEGEYFYKGRELTVKFNYNRTFGDSEFPRAGSWTQPMRPDYTLSLWPKAFTEVEAEKQEMIVHVHFDAKYRVDGLEYLNSEGDIDLNEEKEMQKQGTYQRADLLKMHAYKDAIRRTVGAYVIYPGVKEYRRVGFHEIVPGLGAFPVSPSNNGDGLEAIREFIKGVVDHFCNRASQREQLSFHQYDIHKKNKTDEIHEIIPEFYVEGKTRVKPLTESTVLIGYYNADQYEWIRRENLYNIRIDPENGMEKYGVGEVGAKYLLLHGNEGLITSDIWEIVSEAPELISVNDLKNKKNYPRKPSCKNYLLYKIKPINEKYFGKSKWDLNKLLYVKNGRNPKRPFSVTLEELFKVAVYLSNNIPAPK
jgi:predicted component of viral defense system (DUF524 family)